MSKRPPHNLLKGNSTAAPNCRSDAAGGSQALSPPRRPQYGAPLCGPAAARTSGVGVGRLRQWVAETSGKAVLGGSNEFRPVMAW